MRRVELVGLLLERADLDRYGPALTDAARRLSSTDLADLAVAVAAVAAEAANVGRPLDNGTAPLVPLQEWMRHRPRSQSTFSARTVRRWASSGSLPGAVRRNGRWLVPADARPPAG